jgi:rhamnose utilization protein RhaD (predicted bifunctional aldolase and dehydrogenase)
MFSLYQAEEAKTFVQDLGPDHGEDLALRVYTSRLLGRDPRLVLHGGGNTSVKSRVTETTGETTDVIFVKGSGGNLATIGPKSFPAVRLARLLRLCELPSLSDEQMVMELGGGRVDPSRPQPSVETLVHALVPGKFVDHSHSDALLAITNQPDGAARVRELYGDEVLWCRTRCRGSRSRGRSRRRGRSAWRRGGHPRWRCSTSTASSRGATRPRRATSA